MLHEMICDTQGGTLGTWTVDLKDGSDLWARKEVKSPFSNPANTGSCRQDGSVTFFACCYLYTFSIMHMHAPYFAQTNLNLKNLYQLFVTEDWRELLHETFCMTL